MIPTITASPQTLMDQAPKTVVGYMQDAVRYIDSEFGEGYAAKNPALVAAFIQACAQDFHTSISAAVSQSLGASVNCVSDSIDRVATAVAELDIG